MSVLTSRQEGLGATRENRRESKTNKEGESKKVESDKTTKGVSGKVDTDRQPRSVLYYLLK